MGTRARVYQSTEKRMPLGVSLAPSLVFGTYAHLFVHA